MHNIKRIGILQFLVVLLFLSAGIFTVKILVATKPVIKKVLPKRRLPIVRVESIKLKPVRITISDYGTVEPFREFDLLPQVSGKTVYVSKNLIDGGSFKKGELLVKIDDRDYKIAYTEALSKVKNAKSNLSMLIAQSQAAKSEWNRYGNGGKAPALLIKTPQIEAARAALMAAVANLDMTKLNIERTRITAPCNGRVYSEHVANGQYLNKAQKFATIYCSDRLKVIDYIAPADAVFLRIPGFSTDKPYGSDALLEEMVGKHYLWHGRIIGAAPINEKTRTIPVVISIKITHKPNHYLLPGSFVEVKLKGKTIKNAAIVPQSALHKDDNGKETLFLVSNGKIIDRVVRVEKYIKEGAIIDSGLKNGDLVVVSNGDFLRAGMKVGIIKRKRYKN